MAEVTTDHSRHSSLREKLVEHLVLGEILKAAWLDGQRDIEVLRPEVDNAGYDVVLTARGVTRHVQLKSSFRGSTTSQQTLQIALGEKPGGCVLWVFFDRETLALGPFYWFGGAPGERLPDLTGFRVARHTKGDSSGVKKERPALRVVPKGRFDPLESIGDVLRKLFGPGTTA